MTAVIVTDLGFGDSGKGVVVDALARALPGALVIKHTGGPQCAHNVVTDDGRHHTFAQFGSGTFAGACTWLDEQFLINPMNMFNEAKHLADIGCGDPFALIAVHPQCRIITPFHVATNRLRELSRGEGRHGSCGQGIGETVAMNLARGTDALVAQDLDSADITCSRLLVIAEYLWNEIQKLPLDRHDDLVLDILQDFEGHVRNMSLLVDTYKDWSNRVGLDYMEVRQGSTPLIFEGGQGVLLDEVHGFQPYTTWSNTTAQNAVDRCKVLDQNPIKLGVIRTYQTRHGAGPFPTENPDLDVPEIHNGTGEWQGAWRNGHLDLPLINYAMTCSPIDMLAITHVDRVPPEGWKVCDRYLLDGSMWGVDPLRINEYTPGYIHVPQDQYPEMIADLLNVDLGLTSAGRTAVTVQGPLLARQRSLFDAQSS